MESGRVQQYILGKYNSRRTIILPTTCYHLKGIHIITQMRRMPTHQAIIGILQKKKIFTRGKITKYLGSNKEKGTQNYFIT